MNQEDEESDNESTTITTNTVKNMNVITNPDRDFKNIINSNLTKSQVVTIKKTSTFAYSDFALEAIN